MKNQHGVSSALAWALVSTSNPIFHWWIATIVWQITNQNCAALCHKALASINSALTRLISFPGKNIVDKSIRVAAENIQVAGDITELWTSS